MPAKTTEWNAKTIAALRERHGLTKTDLGRLLFEGVSSPHSAVSQMEQEDGGTNPGSAVRRTLSRLDGMTSEEVAAELREIKAA